MPSIIRIFNGPTFIGIPPTSRTSAMDFPSPIASPFSSLSLLSPPETKSPSPANAGKPKTFNHWVASAKEATAELRRNGSPLPFAWVLVEGKNIPENAIVAGEYRRKPFYIARSFFEGGIHIGKAGPQLKLGAAIPYNGREVEVAVYEVLITALQPIRYMIPELPQIPQPIPHPLNNGLRRLKEIKTVIVVDDSMSMAGELWTEAREALAGVAEMAAIYGTDGVDVFFLNDHRYGLELKNGQDLRQLFDSVVPMGQTPTGEKLSEILGMYIPRLEDKVLNHKPITIIVITDGVPTDDPKQVIIDAARRLDRSGVGLNRLGIQFAQIGDDEDATEALKELDDDLSEAYGIRDMVDTTPFNPNDARFTTDTMTKILLGAIEASLDGSPVRTLKAIRRESR